MTRFLLICLGGAAGTGARYLLAVWITSKAGEGFPFGTLAVNVAGSFAMGFLAQYVASHEIDETTRLALTTGVLGGFTTYSAFNQESLRFLQLDPPAWGVGGAYIASTVIACLLAGLCGMAVAKAAG
jgi:CrcB protein